MTGSGAPICAAITKGDEMGQSTDALMAFGFDLGEELPESFMADCEDGDSFDAEEFLLRDFEAGIPEWAPDGPPDYWDKKRDALTAIPVDIISHCSGDYPMHFLALRGTNVRASRGYPAEAPQREVTQAEAAAMRAFCDKHGIEWEEPKWRIFSMWN